MKRNQVENIRNGRFIKKFQAEENQCEVVIEDAFYGEWKGKNQVLDEDILIGMGKELVKTASRYTTKYNPMPLKIVVSRESEHEDLADKEKPAVTTAIPRFSLEQVALPKDTREQIEVTLSAVSNRDRLNNEWGLGDTHVTSRAVVLNFYGAPGTGKSMTAEAIAHALGKQFLCVNYSELESKYVGETPKNIKKVFAEAEKSDAVLVFDEADSFLSKRLTNITQAADYGVNITRSVMLMELEKFSGIVVFTTNLIENYDAAFKRRIFASIEFLLPDEEARTKIWKMHMGNKLPLAEEVTAEILAAKYEEISGADMKDIVYYAAVFAMNKAKEQAALEDFEKAYQYIMKRYGR